MAQKFVGIDMGNHHVKVAVVSAGLRGVQLVDAFEEPVGAPPEPAEGEAAIDPFSHLLSVTFSALRSRGLLGQTVGVCLPPGLLSYRVLSFPFADERRIAQAVGFEADGQFPMPIEQLSYGHVPVPSTEGGRALVVAARKERLQQLSAVFRRAGSDIKVVTSSAVAAGQVARAPLPAPTPEMLEHGRQPCTLLLDLGHEYTHFTALGAKGPIAVRSLRRGSRQITDAIAHAYELSPGDAEAAKHTDAFLPHRGLAEISPEQMDAGKVVAGALDPILRDLEHTRMWLRSTYQLEVARIMLAGGGTDLNGFEPYVAEQTGLEVVPFAVGATGLKVDDSSSLRRMAGAIGAAYGAARRPLLQLHDTATADGDGGWVQERMSSLIAIGVAIMAFAALDTIARVKAAETQLAAYETELAEATKAAFGSELGPAEVEEKLGQAEGQDLTSLVPERGALETLALLVKAATPSDLATAPPPPPPPPKEESPEGEEGGDDEESKPDESEEAEATPAAEKTGPIPPDAGVVVADDLIITSVEIRERKIELKAEANQGSAQDRLARKLAEIPCISNVSKGRVKGDARKSFQMTMDSRCFQKIAVDEAEGDGEESPSASASSITPEPADAVEAEGEGE
jgi:Tfp pilus assembly PilM family ATPase